MSDKVIEVRSLTPPRIKGVEEVKPKKIRVLWYSDFLRPTGFGNVAEAIISRLNKTGKYEFTVLGINHHGAPYNIPGSKYYHLRDIPVYPCLGNDEAHPLGYGKLTKLLASQDYDIFFALQDSFNMIPMKQALLDAKQMKKEDGDPFAYVLYYPVDGDLREDWVKSGVLMADYPVCYTRYGVEMTKKYAPGISLRHMYHGADLNAFYPFPENSVQRKQFRKDVFQADDNTFVITNVNRNQPRKDLPKTIDAFVLFCTQNKDLDARLYLHCDIYDRAGHNIEEYINNYVPEEYQNRIIVPGVRALRHNDGFDVSHMRNIYASSDVVTSTTTGEGWGLSTTEAMACKIPVVMPRNSALEEIIGKNEERGYLAKSGCCARFVQVADHEIPRPLTDIEDLVTKWTHVLNNKEEAKQKAETAYNWLKDYTWDKITAEWDRLLTDAYRALGKH